MPKSNKQLVAPVIEQHLSSVTQPSVWSAMKRGLAGVCMLGISYTLDTFAGNPEPRQRGVVSDIARNSGFALIFDSVTEIAYAGILQAAITFRGTSNKKTNSEDEIILAGSKKKQRKLAREITRHQQFNKESAPDSEEQALKLYLNLQRYTNIARAGFNLLSTSYGAIRVIINIQDMWSMGISIFSTSWPEYMPGRTVNSSGSLLNYINVPIINIVTFPLLSVGAVYNCAELLLSLASPDPRRNNPPVIALINASAGLGTTKLLIQYIPGFQTAMDTSFTREQFESHSSVQLAHLINRAPMYQVYKNLYQIILNCRDLFNQTIDSVRIEEVNEQDHIHTPATPPQSPASSTVLNSRPPSSVVESTTRSPGLLYRYEQSKSEHESERLLARAPKKKTKGINGVAQAEDLQPDTKEFAEAVQPYEINERELRLSEVSDLRNFSQVKKRVINGHFERLARELPQGSIQEIDGSEFQLHWTWQNRHYRLKYEVPHGVDGTQYKGRKLAKAINVLQVAYLWGLKRQKREDYLNAHSCNIMNIDRLFYIFAERPKF
jgi:hypothetical protein